MRNSLKRNLRKQNENSGLNKEDRVKGAAKDCCDPYSAFAQRMITSLKMFMIRVCDSRSKKSNILQGEDHETIHRRCIYS